MTLEERLAVLERRCRVLSGILASVLLLCGITLLTGAGQREVSTELRATALTIVDANGNERIRLSAGDPFGATFLDTTGQPRVMLGALKNVGVVQLSNGQGRVIDLIADNNGGRIGVSRNGKFPVVMLSAGTDARLELRQSGNQRTVYPGDAAVRNDPFGN